MQSILCNKEECFICGSKRWLELHHIFGAANRNLSTKYGLVVYLCHSCHNEAPNGVHFNKERNDWLKAKAQKIFKEVYPDLNFLKIFGKNYL